MNYRHGFHAGNHADVLKHVVLLSVCARLMRKPGACFALDTHAGRGLYALDGAQAARTREADSGVRRLDSLASKLPALLRYREAIAACRAQHGPQAYPGSPWLLAHALRVQDRIACCELQPGEADILRANFRHDRRLVVHQRDGYAALPALLPPRTATDRFARGLVLIDPPYEAQLDEFDAALAALREGLGRWPQGVFLLWYPIKQGRALARFYRRSAQLPAASVFCAELLVREDDSPLRMNGSGVLLLNPPWQLDAELQPALSILRDALGEAGAQSRLEWLRAAA